MTEGGAECGEFLVHGAFGGVKECCGDFFAQCAGESLTNAMHGLAGGGRFEGESGADVPVVRLGGDEGAKDGKLRATSAFRIACLGARHGGVEHLNGPVAVVALGCGDRGFGSEPFFGGHAVEGDGCGSASAFFPAGCAAIVAEVVFKGAQQERTQLSAGGVRGVEQPARCQPAEEGLCGVLGILRREAPPPGEGVERIPVGFAESAEGSDGRCVVGAVACGAYGGPRCFWKCRFLHGGWLLIAAG